MLVSDSKRKNRYSLLWLGIYYLFCDLNLPVGVIPELIALITLLLISGNPTSLDESSQ
jgi:hypothetical protein